MFLSVVKSRGRERRRSLGRQILALDFVDTWFSHSRERTSPPRIVSRGRNPHGCCKGANPLLISPLCALQGGDRIPPALRSSCAQRVLTGSPIQAPSIITLLTRRM